MICYLYSHIHVGLQCLISSTHFFFIICFHLAFSVFRWSLRIIWFVVFIFLFQSNMAEGEHFETYQEDLGDEGLIPGRERGRLSLQ